MPPKKKKKELIHKAKYSTVLCSAVPSCVHTSTGSPPPAHASQDFSPYGKSVIHSHTLTHTRMHARTPVHTHHTPALAPQHALPGTAPRILEFPLASRFLPPLASTPPRSVIRLNKSN